MSVPDAAIAAGGRGFRAYHGLSTYNASAMADQIRAVLEAASVEITCDRCEGFGRIREGLMFVGSGPCSTCSGSGVLHVLRTEAE